MYQTTGPQRRPTGGAQPNTVASIRTPSGTTGNVVNSSGNPMQLNSTIGPNTGGSNTPGNTSANTISRILDMLDQVRAEVEAQLQQANMHRIEREDMEQKIRSQVNEVNDMAQQFRSLEALHRRVKMQYEDDIARLRHQLHESQMNQQQAASQNQVQNNSPSMIPPSGPGTTTASLGQGSQSLHLNQSSRQQNNRINAITSRPEEITNLPKLLSRNTNNIGGGNTSPSLRLRNNQQQQQLASNTTLANLSRRSDDAVVIEGKASPPSLHLQSVPSSSSSSRATSSSTAPREMDINAVEGSTDISSDSLNRSSKRPSGAPTQQPLKRLNVGNRSDSATQEEESPKQAAVDRTEKTDIENGEFSNDHTDAVAVKSEHAQETATKAEPESPSNNENAESMSRHSKVKWMISYNTKASSYPETDRPHVVKKHMLDHQSVVCCVRFSNDGRYVASGCHKTAQVYDVQSGQQVFTVKRPQIPPAAEGEDAYVRAVCFSPDGTKLIAGMPQNTIRIWDIATKNEVQSLAGHESEIYSLDYVNDVIASGSGDRKVKLWDARNGSCLTTFGNESSGPTDGVTSVALSPDGTLLASASLDKIVRIWNTETSQLVDRLEGHNDSVYSIAFSPDGKNIISGSLDRTLMLWNVSASGRTTSRPNLLFQGHKDFVLSVAYAPDGRWLMSGSKDRTVVFWDPRSTRSVLTVSGYRNSVISVASSPASPHFATGSGDCFACIWDYSCQPI